MDSLGDAHVIRLEIPRATPSRNATHHRHWRVAYREKKLWTQEIHVALRQQMHSSGRYQLQKPARIRLTIERTGQRLLDQDNLVGGFKSLLDAMKALQLIVDDDPAHLELIAKQSKGTPRTVITLEAA